MWCSSYFCGAPFISDLQSGVFYPLSIVFLFGPVSKAFNIYVLAHLLLGFIFTYQFIKKIVSARAALFAGTAYCFSGYVLSSVNTLNNLSTLIWLPAILWSMTTALKDKNKSGFFLTVLFCCMSILAGEPQLFLMSGILLFLFCIIYYPSKGPINSTFKTSLILFIIIAASLLITFVQLGPAFTDYSLSVRQGGMSYADSTRDSLSFGSLKHFIIPLHFSSDYVSSHESYNNLFNGSNGMSWLMSVYPGAMILPLALTGLLINCSQKKLFWLIVFSGSIILALGDNTPVYSLVYKIFSIFRYPEKFILLSSFSIIVLAAYGFDELFKKINNRVVINSVFIIAIILLFTDLYSNHRFLNPVAESKLYQEVHPDLKPVLNDSEIFRIYVDQESFTKSLSQGSIIDHHKVWQNMLFPNTALLKNIDQVNGTTGLELRYQYIITEILLKPWKDKIDFLKMANVKYIVTERRLNKIPGMEDKVERINSHLYSVNGFLPRARIIGKLKPIIKGTMDELTRPYFNYSDEAITNTAIYTEYSTQTVREVKNIVYRSNSRIEIETNSEEPGILVLSESSYPGWKVYVDGKEKECLWLNLLFQGVKIDEGRHKVEFVYSPDKFGFYILISVISVFLFILMWSRYGLSSRRILKHAA